MGQETVAIRVFIFKQKKDKAVEITIKGKAEYTNVDYPVSKASQASWQDQRDGPARKLTKAWPKNELRSHTP